MRIAYSSDVHLEFGAATITNDVSADVLVLAGDVCVVEDLKRHREDPSTLGLGKQVSPRLTSAMVYRDFLRECAAQFKHVIMVMGNHEHYTGDLRRSYEVLKDQCATISPNIHLLEDETIVIDDVLFVGSTLWTDLNNQDSLTSWHLQLNMSDYNIIRDSNHGYSKLHPNTTSGIHYVSVQYLKGKLSANREGTQTLPVVVVTHHAPTFMSVPMEFRGDRLMNGGYASDLSDIILDNPEIKVWIHGHMHDPVDYEVGGCRVVANPRGYYGHQTNRRQLDLLTVDV